MDWDPVNCQIERYHRPRTRRYAGTRAQVRADKGIEPEKSAAQKFAQFVATHRRELQDLSVQKAVRASGLKLSYELRGTRFGLPVSGRFDGAGRIWRLIGDCPIAIWRKFTVLAFNKLPTFASGSRPAPLSGTRGAGGC